MKTLYLIIIYLLFAVLGNGHAEETKWVKWNPGCFEHQDPIHNIQLSLDGNFFFVLDNINLHFYKYDRISGEIVNTYDIFVPDSIGKLPRDKIQIQLSPDTKTYTVSSLFFPIIYFVELNSNKVLFSRRIKLDDVGSDDKFPFLSTIYKNFIIYQQPYSGGWSGQYETYYAGSHTIIINTDNNDSNYIKKYGIFKLITTKNQNRTLFLTEDRFYSTEGFEKKFKNTNVNLFGEMFVTSKLLIHQENIPLYQYEEIALSKQGNEFAYLWVPSNSLTIHKLDEVKVDTANSPDKIYSYCFINDNYCALLTKYDKQLLRIYNRKNLVQVDSLFLNGIELKTSLLQNPNYSEVYFVTKYDKLRKYDFSKLDSLFAAFRTKQRTASTVIPVQFDNLTTGGATSYLWEFGDGETSTEENPSHLYYNVGVYSVKLTAFNTTDTSTYTIKDYINILPYIKAEFEIEKLTDTDSLVVVTKNLSEGNIVDYKWIVGDSVYKEKEPVFTVYKPGFFDVSLIISDGSISDTLTKVDYLNVVQGPIDREFIGNYKLFTHNVDIFPTSVSEFNSKYYMLSNYSSSVNDTLRNFFNIYSCDTNFQNFEDLLTKKYDYNPKSIFFNKNNDSIAVVLLSDYLVFYNLKTKEQIGYKAMGNFDHKINENKLLLFRSYNGMGCSFQCKSLTDNFDLNTLYTYEDNSSDGFIYMEINADINKKSLFILQSFIYVEDVQITPSKWKTVYENRYRGNNFLLDTTTSVFKVKSNKSKVLFSHRYDSDNSERNKNAAYANLSHYKKTIFATPKRVVNLVKENYFNLFSTDSLDFKLLTTKSFRNLLEISDIIKYNDSLFLAGGSLHGKATLFFLSTENLEIKKIIPINALFGRITSIERTSDGEFLLLSENQINKKVDNFYAMKTKNLGKDAYPLSVDLGNETPKFDFSNIGNYLLGNSLSINYDNDISNPILEIYDFMGRKLVSTNELVIDTKSKQATCDLSQFGNEIPERAIYFYILRDSGNVIRGKFMR